MNTARSHDWLVRFVRRMACGLNRKGIFSEGTPAKEERSALTGLELELLFALRGGECHGLEAGKRLSKAIGRTVGPGSYYKALHRLEERALVASRWEADSVAHQGPRRRLYRLVPEGEAELRRLGGALTLRGATTWA